MGWEKIKFQFYNLLCQIMWNCRFFRSKTIEIRNLLWSILCSISNYSEREYERNRNKGVEQLKGLQRLRDSLADFTLRASASMSLASRSLSFRGHEAACVRSDSKKQSRSLCQGFHELSVVLPTSTFLRPSTHTCDFVINWEDPPAVASVLTPESSMNKGSSTTPLMAWKSHELPFALGMFFFFKFCSWLSGTSLGCFSQTVFPLVACQVHLDLWHVAIIFSFYLIRHYLAFI